MGRYSFKQDISGVCHLKLNSCNLVIFFISIFLLAACATTTKVDKLGYDYVAKDKNCEIQFFKDVQPQKKS